MTRYEKLTRYVDSVVQDMDWNTMYQYVFESMLYDLEHSTTDEELNELYNQYFEDNDEETTA